MQAPVLRRVAPNSRAMTFGDGLAAKMRNSAVGWQGGRKSNRQFGMTKPKIVIDCDPGHDDAVAILYAARHLDQIGITTCHGNNTIDNVTNNTLALLTLAGLDIPVAKGSADPLVGCKILPNI